jgi:pyruvate dehydrogenase E2 component (dihydrolipoamide acetyltransferase)
MMTNHRPVLRRPGEGRTVAVVGDVYRFLAVGDETDGKYALWETVVPPGGGPPPHVHSREEEGFYVLEGEITFTVGDERIVATEGMFAHMPVGTPHSFKNEGDRPARMLISVAPAGLEQMFFEVGVPLAEVKGSGPSGRITHEDVQGFVKGVMSGAVHTGAQKTTPAAGGVGLAGLLPWPQIDFTKFGEVERKDLSRIKKISGANLHRNWVMIPHVTNHDDADITDLEAFRLQMNKEHEKAGVRLSMLAFMIKAAVATLKKFPEFNASIDGDNIILKQYYHIGFAADTPNGLVVPVIRDCDKKGVIEIGKEMGDLAKLARDGKLKPDQMQGGCFTISSLGGIGGVYFTPIINAPEVAIMGACRSFYKPVWDGKQFVPRLVQPLSLSWDHRVIDGAAAARFNAYFANLLADFRRILL